MKARRAKKGFGEVMRRQREAGIPTPRPYHGMETIKPYLPPWGVHPGDDGRDPILDRMEHDA